MKKFIPWGQKCSTSKTDISENTPEKHSLLAIASEIEHWNGKAFRAGEGDAKNKYPEDT